MTSVVRHEEPMGLSNRSVRPVPLSDAALRNEVARLQALLQKRSRSVVLLCCTALSVSYIFGERVDYPRDSLSHAPISGGSGDVYRSVKKASSPASSATNMGWVLYRWCFYY